MKSVADKAPQFLGAGHDGLVKVSGPRVDRQEAKAVDLGHDLAFLVDPSPVGVHVRDPDKHLSNAPGGGARRPFKASCGVLDKGGTGRKNTIMETNQHGMLRGGEPWLIGAHRLPKTLNARFRQPVRWQC